MSSAKRMIPRQQCPTIPSPPQHPPRTSLQSTANAIRRSLGVSGGSASFARRTQGAGGPDRGLARRLPGCGRNLLRATSNLLRIAPRFLSIPEYRVSSDTMISHCDFSELIPSLYSTVVLRRYVDRSRCGAVLQWRAGGRQAAVTMVQYCTRIGFVPVLLRCVPRCATFGGRRV